MQRLDVVFTDAKSSSLSTHLTIDDINSFGPLFFLHPMPNNALIITNHRGVVKQYVGTPMSSDKAKDSLAVEVLLQCRSIDMNAAIPRAWETTASLPCM